MHKKKHKTLNNFSHSKHIIYAKESRPFNRIKGWHEAQEFSMERELEMQPCEILGYRLNAGGHTDKDEKVKYDVRAKE